LLQDYFNLGCFEWLWWLSSDYCC